MEHVYYASRFLIHEQYSRDLSKKIKTAKHDRMRRGILQSSDCVFGYTKGKNGTLAVDELAAMVVRMIFELAADGLSLSDIAKRLYDGKHPTPSEYNNRHTSNRRGSDVECKCLWGKSVLLNILSDEQYLGTYVAGKTKVVDVGSGKQVKNEKNDWIQIPNHHPAIIDKALFDKAREVRSVRKAPLRHRELGTSERYAALRDTTFMGKIICGCCGHTMTRSITKNAAYHCRHTIPAPDAACHRVKIAESDLTKTLYTLIHKQAEVILNLDVTEDLSKLDIQRTHITEHDKQIETCIASKQRLYERYVLGEINAEEYMARKAEHDTKLRQLEQERAYWSEQATQAADAQKTNAASRKIAETAVRESCFSKDMADVLLNKVYVYPEERIEVLWKLSSFTSDNTK